MLRFSIYDVDNDSTILMAKTPDMLGSVDMSMAEFLKRSAATIEETDGKISDAKPIEFKLLKRDGSQAKEGCVILLTDISASTQDLGKVSQVRITVKCRNLPKMDLLSDSDPICCLFTKNNDTGEFDLSGKTELIMNNHNPDFLETFTVNHYAKKVQQMDFRVYDADDAKGVDFKDKDLLGHSLITMDELLVRVRGAWCLVLDA
jgi:Ca2+-dependent lipid-binding protein